jgi:hypothetical protein
LAAYRNGSANMQKHQNPVQFRTAGERRGNPAASLQFVRKLSDSAPSRANEAVFDEAIEHVFAAARKLVRSLETNAAQKDREIEAQKAKARAAERFGRV